MNVIDVTIAGGPDLAAVVATDALAGGRVLRVTVANDGPVPARLERVLVPIESPTVRSVVAPGWDADDPGHDGSPAGTDPHGAPVVVTDQGTVGWLGSRRHEGRVVVQRDGWLLTAVATFGGVLLGPGERVGLDSLWLGGEPDGFTAAWVAEHEPCRPVGDTTAVVVAAGAGPGAVAAAAGELDRVASGIGVLVAASTDDAEAVADAAGRRRCGWGVVVTPFDPPLTADLSRPEALDSVRVAAAPTGGLRPDLVVVTGAARALSAAEWGRASTTPVAALRAGLRAVREGIGGAPVLHVAGGPPAALGGAADVVDTGPGWPAPGALEAVARRSALHATAWVASPGPLPYGVPAPVLGGLAPLSGVRLLWPPGSRPGLPVAATPPAS